MYPLEQSRCALGSRSLVRLAADRGRPHMNAPHRRTYLLGLVKVQQGKLVFHKLVHDEAVETKGVCDLTEM